MNVLLWLHRRRLVEQLRLAEANGSKESVEALSARIAELDAEVAAGEVTL